jgi:signal transduction histidine kinase
MGITDKLKLDRETLAAALEKTIQSRAATQWLAMAALVVAFMVGMAATAVSLSNLSDLNDMADRRKAALIGQFNLEHLLSQLKDMETGQRGFVVTGREEFLEPYQTALSEIPAAYSKLVLGTPTERRNSVVLSDLQQLIAKREALAANAVADRKLRGAAMLNDPDIFIAGKLAMDQIRALVAGLHNSQDQYIGEIETQMLALKASANSREWLSSIFVSILVTGAVALLLVEYRRRLMLQSELQKSNSRLEQRVSERTAALAAAGAQIRGFAARLESNMETERLRISREVHDQLGQVFTAIKMIFHSMKPGSLAVDQRAALANAIDSGVATTRRIAAELRPSLLDDLGLAAALEHFAQGIAKSHGLHYAVKMDGHQNLTAMQTFQIFRIGQEAVLNAGRHAKAQNITITSRSVDGMFELSVEDDGQGFDPNSVRDGALGLVGLRERTAVMGGDALVTARTGGGTSVLVRVPHKWHGGNA